MRKDPETYKIAQLRQRHKDLHQGALAHHGTQIPGHIRQGKSAECIEMTNWDVDGQLQWFDAAHRSSWRNRLEALRLYCRAFPSGSCWLARPLPFSR